MMRQDGGSIGTLPETGLPKGVRFVYDWDYRRTEAPKWELPFLNGCTREESQNLPNAWKHMGCVQTPNGPPMLMGHV